MDSRGFVLPFLAEAAIVISKASSCQFSGYRREGMRREGAFTSSKDDGGMKLITNLHLVPTLRIYLLMDANI